MTSSGVEEGCGQGATHIRKMTKETSRRHQTALALGNRDRWLQHMAEKGKGGTQYGLHVIWYQSFKIQPLAGDSKQSQPWSPFLLP
jgi:hypothetical protein